MTIITINKQPDTVILSIDPVVMRHYEAHAKTMSLTAVEFLNGLLADWPAILAPVQPVTTAKLPYTPNDAILENIREGEYLAPFGSSY